MQTNEQPLDPNDVRVWWRLFLAAIAGLQAKDGKAATAYIAFTTEHRGPDVASDARVSLRRYASTRAFANAKAMLEAL